MSNRSISNIYSIWLTVPFWVNRNGWSLIEMNSNRNRWPIGQPVYLWTLLRNKVFSCSENNSKTLKYWVAIQRGQFYLMGEGASLSLVDYPSSNGVTIKMPYGVNVLHRPASHPVFSYLVGQNWIWLYF